MTRDNGAAETRRRASDSAIVARGEVAVVQGRVFDCAQRDEPSMRRWKALAQLARIAGAGLDGDGIPSAPWEYAHD